MAGRVGLVISLSAAAGIALVALGMVLSPGPNMIYLVSRTLSQGRKAGLVSLLGVAAGFLVYLIATAAGLIAVFTAVPVLYEVIKIAGAGYLLWLAFHALRSAKGNPFTAQDLPHDRPHKLFTMGLVTNLLNPKIAIIYVSVLPQFIDPARGHIAVQGLTLGLIQSAVAITVNGLIVLTAGKVAGWLQSRPRWVTLQRWFMGTVLGVLAIRLLFERVRPVSA